jgi:hypothetical protein
MQHFTKEQLAAAEALGIDPELLASYGGDKAAAQGDQDVFKPIEGKKYLIRVLPGSFGSIGKKFHIPLVQHWAPDPRPPEPGRDPMDIAFLCPINQELRGKAGNRDFEGGSTLATHCPFCERRDVIKNDFAQAGLKRNLNFQEANLMNVKVDGVVLKWFAHRAAFRELITLYIDRVTNAKDDFIHPVNGSDLEMIRGKNGQGHNTFMFTLQAPSPIASTPPDIQNILSSATDLEKFLLDQMLEQQPMLQASFDKLVDDVRAGRRDRGNRSELSGSGPGSSRGATGGMAFRMPGEAGPPRTAPTLPPSRTAAVSNPAPPAASAAAMEADQIPMGDGSGTNLSLLKELAAITGAE